MNRLIGQKLSIVTAKPQTTWQRITGIHTTDRTQAIFLDTPGLLLAKDLFQHSMLEEALDAVREGDVILLLVDATDPLREAEENAICEALSLSASHLIVVINKIDEASPDEIARDLPLGQFRAQGRRHAGSRPFTVREWRRCGRRLQRRFPKGRSSIHRMTSRPRRCVFSWESSSGRPSSNNSARRCRTRSSQRSTSFVRIRTPFISRRISSWKGTRRRESWLETRGRRSVELGRSSREKIEEFIGRRVYLELRVKLRPKWRRRSKGPRSLRLSSAHGI